MELKATPRVLFVCHGNVFRSAFAHHLLARRVASLGASIEVRSAGVRATPGQRPLALVQEVARDFGVELEHHRATMIDESAATWATEILVMEYDMGHVIGLRCPAVADRVSLLGDLAEPGLEVLDIPSWPAPAEARARADEAIAEVRARLMLIARLVDRWLFHWRSDART